VKGAARLAGGRLRLWHGPIDLVIRAEGAPSAVAAAEAAARAAFEGLLDGLVAELPRLRAPLADRGSAPDPGVFRPRRRPGDAAGGGLRHPVARRMARAVAPFAHECFVTPMAAVAGAVADEIATAMWAAAPLERLFVNNGGDIALRLAPGQGYRVAMAAHGGARLGELRLTAEDGIRGIATSGRHGRSLSLGIADSVTVLAATTAAADAAATLIANAVDLPGHPAITRGPACSLDPDSDLGAREVVTGVGALTAAEVAGALARGLARAKGMRERRLISAAALYLAGDARMLGPAGESARKQLKVHEHA